MMTKKDIAMTIDLLITAYDEKAYPVDSQEKMEKMINLWTVMFEDDSPLEVLKAVKNCIATCHFPPRIVDIKQRISKAKLKGQMTEMEAWNEVRKAIDKADSRNSAIEAFKSLPPILQKLVCDPSRLRYWYKCGDDTLEGVISSNVQRSYRELALREADYYTLPADLQQAEQWRIEAPALNELPEPVKQKTVDDIYDEIEQKTKEYRERYGLKPNAAYESRVAEFLNGVKRQ